MQKKILALALLVLAVAFGAVACGKSDEIEAIPGFEPFEYTTIDGEAYVTNVYGDLIPVTTSENGSVELLEDLVTKTKEQVEKEKEKATATTPQTPQTPNEGNGTVPDGGNSGNSGSGGNSSGGMVIGNKDVQNDDSGDAVIVW